MRKILRLLKVLYGKPLHWVSVEAGNCSEITGGQGVGKRLGSRCPESHVAGWRSEHSTTFEKK